MRLLCILTVLVGTAAAGVMPAGATPHLVQLDVSVTPDAQTNQATVIADIVVDASGETVLPLTLLERPPARVIRLVHDEPSTHPGQRLALDRSRSPLLGAQVSLPGADADGFTRFRLHLEIEAAWRQTPEASQLVAPIPVPRWAPDTVGDDAFQVTLVLPSEGSLVRAFPTSFQFETPRRLVATLPVPPAFVGATTVPAGTRRLTVERVVDLAAVGLLAVLLGSVLLRLKRSYT